MSDGLPGDETAPMAGGPSSTVVLGDGEPIFSFRGDDLIGFLWELYARTRISDALSEMPQFSDEPDPMQDWDAQSKLTQEWADKLMALPVRDDGTVVFDKRPWLVNCESPNA